ncbi:MAG: flavodoxin-dependent (E)-4-hydroxy-3-methylbut-2-enyl-diphosphate synthase [Candidatus Gracilibacteria bacterium]
MQIPRRKTRTCLVGHGANQVKIGSAYPVAIQTMTTAKTHDIHAVIKEIKTVQNSGCDLIRVAIPTLEDAKAIPLIKEKIAMPLVADIHFDPRLAIAAMEYGADKIRINPGNFLDLSALKQVVTLAKQKEVAIRIGVNAGSLEKDLWAKYGAPNADALTESAIRWVKFMEDLDFTNFVVSLKSSNVRTMIEAYQKFAEQDAKIHKTEGIPLHLGVTEAGLLLPGAIKSAVGLGTLLSQGVGDTIRVSTVGSIADEVMVCREILKSLGLYSKEPNLIACPTCGRTEIDLPAMVKKVEKAIKHIKKPIRIAVMGCVVNGPGEAREADFALAGGKHSGALYYKGQLYKSGVPEKDLVKELIKLIEEKS